MHIFAKYLRSYGHELCYKKKHFKGWIQLVSFYKVMGVEVEGGGDSHRWWVVKNKKHSTLRKILTNIKKDIIYSNIERKTYIATDGVAIDKSKLSLGIF